MQMLLLLAMESIVTWDRIFTRSWQEGNNKAVNRILKDAPDYLQAIPDSDKEAALEILYNKKKGLYTSIKSILDKQELQLTSFKNSLKEFFKLLQFIMEFFKQHYEPYIMQTRDISLSCIKNVSYTFTIRKVAGDTLKKLIMLFPNYEMKLDEIIHEYDDEKLLYNVFGAIARYRPKTKNIDKLVHPIFLKLLYNLQKQSGLSERKQQKDYIKSYLECLLDMLVNFKPLSENTTVLYFENIYEVFLLMCKLHKTQDIINKILYILSTHTQYFSTLMFRDYEKWHEFLNILYKNNPTYIVADTLKAFYKIISHHLLKHDKEDIFRYFQNYFKLNIYNPKISFDELGLNIYGLGQLSVAYNKYSPSEINELFQIISHQALLFSKKKEQDDKNIQLLPDYLQALSEILNSLPSISLYKLNIIIKLSILNVKKFAELKIRNQTNAIAALKNTFVNIKRLENNLQRQYFHALFYEGTLWSCSHALFVDIELQQEIKNLPEYPLCYKNYLPLWHSLFNIENYQLEFIQQIFYELISVLILFIDQLNLNVKPKQNKFLSDTSLSLKAENEADFRYFINLVDLYTQIFEEINIELLRNHVERILKCFIKSSYKYPMVSGFYKLIKVIFRKPNIFYDYDTRVSEFTRELIPQYLSDVAQLIYKFSDELQLSCIDLIFNTPVFFITERIEVIPVFKIALKIGLTDPPLAYSALETLKNWANSLKNKNLLNFYEDIFSYVKPYLTDEDFLLDINHCSRGSKNDKAQNSNSFSERNLQKKILQICCSLKYDSVLEDNMFSKVEESWNMKYLPFELLFPDLHVEINFEKFIDQIKNLIENGNRRTKFSACELLHTIITIILGKKLMDQCFSKGLCSAVLKLGCESDSVIKNLYHPLVIQLTHYLSIRPIRESQMTQIFIDSLFEGLTDELNPSLKDYCGVCLKEFVEWTIKQSPEYDRSNFSKLVQRIINFSLSPSNNKRLAAAIAFNHLCTTLGGSISVINRHWLAFLYVFVKSLEKCDDIRIISAINNVESVIKVTSNTLNAKSLHREKPLGFANETLKSATMWLFDQCGSLNVRCRLKSMELFESLYLFIPGNRPIEEFFRSLGASSVNRIILKNLDQDFDRLTVHHIQTFLKCLDFYIWIFNKGFLTPESLLEDEDARYETDAFFRFFSRFVSLVISGDVKKESESNTSTAKEAEELTYLFNKATLEIFRFISILLITKKRESTNILKYICTDDLYTLIGLFTLRPRTIGLTARILQTITSQQLENWFTEIMKHLPEAYVSELRRHFLIEKIEDYIFFTNPDDIVHFKRDRLPSKYFMRNIVILRKCKLFNFEIEHNITTDFAKEKIIIIFEALRSAVENGDVLKRIDSHIRAYLEGVVRFLLLDYQSELLETLIDLIVESPSRGSFAATDAGYALSHQEYLLDTFKLPMFTCMMKNPADALKILDKKLPQSPDETFLLIEELVIFSQHKRSECSETLATEIIKRCSEYRRQVGDVVRRADRFFNINRVAASLLSNSMAVIYTDGLPNALFAWIVEELSLNNDFDRKFAVMESFLMCMIDEAGTSRHQFLEILQKLRLSDPDAWLEKLRSSEVERSRAIQCLHVLARLLEVTRSSLVYEGMARFAAGACEFLIADSMGNSLRVYLAMISADKLLKSLETVYELFKKRSFTGRERLDFVRYFLLLTLESCRVPVLGKFYEQNAREMSELVSQVLPEADLVERKAALVTKIGCYRLLELMFCKLPPSMIILYAVEDKQVDLGLFLAERAMEVRKLVPRHEQERELTRLLHCAAFNFFVGLACAKHDESIYKVIFRESDHTDQFLWKRIIDCERSYDLSGTSRSFRWQPINIRRINEEGAPVVSPYGPYLRRDSPRVSELQMLAEGSNGRQWIGLEHDEFNMHECAASVTGMIIHLVNSKVSRLPSVGEDPKTVQLPEWLVSFRIALADDNDNVNLFLMRIIGNTRAAFVPYLRSLFVVLMKCLCHYLARNPLNYLIRDMLLIIVESRYELREREDIKMAQKLIELMVERVYDSRAQVYEYNMEMLDRLMSVWSDHLSCPENIDAQIQISGVEPAMRIVLLMLKREIEPEILIARREVHAMIRRSMFMWQEPTTPPTFETLGWLMRYLEPEQQDILIEEDLIELFTDIKRYDVDYCANLVCLLCEGCPRLIDREDLQPFMDPRLVEDDKCRADCLELFARMMDDLEPELEPELPLLSHLERLDLKGVLRDWDLPCLDVAFKILDKLIRTLSPAELLPYARLLEVYVAPGVLLEYKRNAYDFFARAYEVYADVESQESDTLRRLCRDALIGGASDPSDEIQDTVLDFWCGNAGLPETSLERLRDLLRMYSPRVHASYSQFLALVMLDLAAQVPESERLLYSRLVPCHYEDYEIVAPRTRRRSRTRAPLFAPSLLAQMERAVAQQGSRLKRPAEEERLQDAPDTSLGHLDGLARSSLMRSSRDPVPDPSENKLSKRIFEGSPGMLTRSPIRTAAHEYFRKLRKETRAQRETVKINRKYRLGNYPDVEITQSGVVASLQGLARTDRGFASKIVVSLVTGLAKLHPELQPVVDETCRRALEQPNDFAAPALEILLGTECANFDARDVAKLAVSMNLHGSAILLLEKDSIRRHEASYAVPVQKLMGVKVLEHRFQLAKLYKSIGHEDVVSNILRDWTQPAISCHLRRGHVAEIEGDWATAGAAYEEGHGVETDDSQDYCLEGMFRCFNELSSWTEFNKKIDHILNKDYNSVWENPKKGNLLQWIFTGQLESLLDDLDTGRSSGSPLLDHLDDWINERGTELMKEFGEQMSMLYLCREPPDERRSRFCLRRCVDGAKEDWISSGSFAIESKRRAFGRLRIVEDIDAFHRTLSSDDLANASCDLIRHWEEETEKEEEEEDSLIGRHDLSNWTLRMRYRLSLSSILFKKLQNATLDADVRKDLLISSLSQQLKTAERAIKNKKDILAKKYMAKVKGSLDKIDSVSSDYLKLHHNFNLLSSSYNLLSAEMGSTATEKLVRCVNSWRQSHALAMNDSVDPSTRIKAKHQVCDATSVLFTYMQKDAEYTHLIADDQFVQTTLGLSSSIVFEYAFHNYRYNALKSLCSEGSVEEIIKGHETFAKYCYSMISDVYDRNSNDLKDFVEAALKTMTMDCTKTISYFPCLLKYLLCRKNQQNIQLFATRCRDVPSWMFLYWQEQIISQLALPHKSLVLPIVERLAKNYPNAIIYSFRAICEYHPRLREDPAIDIIYKMLFADEKIEKFFNAMKYLCQPEQYLKYHLLTIIRKSNDHKSLIEALDNFINEIFADGHRSHVQGPIHKRIFIKYRNELEKIKSPSNVVDLKKAVEHFCANLDEAMSTRMSIEKDSSRLDNYSPYLAHLSEESVSIEVPGQYVGKEKPLVSYHAKIARFEDLVHVQGDSLRISLIGTDGKTYDFLVTIGMNARQEVRVQRIFELFNDSLRREPCCRSKQLLVNTSCAVSLSRMMILKRWIGGTKSLRECVDFSISDTSTIETVTREYRNWIEQASDEKTSSKSLMYKQALLKYSAVEVIAKMRELDRCIPWDSLRKTFIHLSPSADCFIQLRRKLILNYSTMCIVQWIMGIGNRLLTNIHVELKTGRCFGTDFRLVFGAGHDQPIPELVPFRLTAHILGLLRPFREQDFFVSTMSDVLNALRSDKSLITDCLETFLYEPFDWNERLNELWREDDEKHEGVQWSFKTKMSIVRKKLSGARPSNIMLEELSCLHESHNKLDCFAVYECIINGNELHHATARIALKKKNDLTTGEQVQCLLDQATDPNVLGRMSAEWHPFV